jgi:hypothetical protein
MLSNGLFNSAAPPLIPCTARMRSQREMIRLDGQRGPHRGVWDSDRTFQVDHAFVSEHDRNSCRQALGFSPSRRSRCSERHSVVE